MVKPRTLELTDVTVNMRVPIDMPSRLAHHLNVQDIGELYQLSFFEIIFPLISSATSKEEQEAIQSSGLVANCVSKINIPKSRFPDFLKAMTEISKTKKNA